MSSEASAVSGFRDPRRHVRAAGNADQDSTPRGKGVTRETKTKQRLNKREYFIVAKVGTKGSCE